MPHKYVKRAVVVQAVQWTGFNVSEVKAFVTNNRALFRHLLSDPPQNAMSIVIKDGAMVDVNISDYIVRDVGGDYFPMRPDSFAQFYDRIE